MNSNLDVSGGGMAYLPSPSTKLASSSNEGMCKVDEAASKQQSILSTPPVSPLRLERKVTFPPLEMETGKVQGLMQRFELAIRPNSGIRLDELEKLEMELQVAGVDKGVLPSRIDEKKVEIEKQLQLLESCCQKAPTTLEEVEGYDREFRALALEFSAHKDIALEERFNKLSGHYAHGRSALLKQLVSEGKVEKRVVYHLVFEEQTGRLQEIVKEKLYTAPGGAGVRVEQTTNYMINSKLGEGGMAVAVLLTPDMGELFASRKEKVLKLFKAIGEESNGARILQVVQGPGIEKPAKLTETGEITAIVGGLERTFAAASIVKWYEGSLGDTIYTSQNTYLDALEDAGNDISKFEKQTPEAACMLLTMTSPEYTGAWRMDNAISAIDGCLHAHDKGIIHLDLKVDNMLVSNLFKSDKRVVISDWGGAMNVPDKEALLDYIRVTGGRLVTTPGNCPGSEMMKVTQLIRDLAEKMENGAIPSNEEVALLQQKLEALQVYNVAVLLKELLLLIPEGPDNKEYEEVIGDPQTTRQTMAEEFEVHPIEEWSKEELAQLQAEIATVPMTDEQIEELQAYGISEHLIEWVNRVLHSGADERAGMIEELRIIREGISKPDLEPLYKAMDEIRQA